MNVKNNLKRLWFEKQARDEQGLTPNSASKQMEISPDTIKLWLAVTPARLDLRVMERFARFFGVNQIVIDFEENKMSFSRKENTND